MKNKKNKNNQSFYNYNVVKLLEKLIETSNNPSQKSSYWILGEAIKGQPTLFIDCLIETHRFNNPFIYNENFENHKLKIDGAGNKKNQPTKDLGR